MGLLISAIVLLALLGVAAAAVRGSRRQEAELRAELLGALQARARTRPDLRVTIGPDALAAGAAGSRRTLPLRRLMDVARRGHDTAAVAAAALELLASPPRPLDCSFSLKIHGPRVAARLATPASMELRPRDPRPAQTPLEDLRLVVTYAVGDRLVTEEHLREQGIDTRDLHGIALAVQRQELDEELPRRVLASGPNDPRPEILRSTDGSAGATLLTLADALRPGEALAARLAGPDRLALAPPGFSWPAAGDDPAPEPIDLVVEPGGYRIL